MEAVEPMPNWTLMAPARVVSRELVELSLLYAMYCPYPAVDLFDAPVSIMTP
jgi:hypothetical protein